MGLDQYMHMIVHNHKGVQLITRSIKMLHSVHHDSSLCRCKICLRGEYSPRNVIHGAWQPPVWEFLVIDGETIHEGAL
jgi:hypothetical protein